MGRRFGNASAVAAALLCLAAAGHDAGAQVRLLMSGSRYTAPGCSEVDQTRSQVPLRDLQSGRVSSRNIATNRPPQDLADRNATPAPVRKGADAGLAMVGSSTAPDCTYLDVVAIVFVDQHGKANRCSGIKLAHDAVLTAAHCACGPLASYWIMTGAGLKIMRERKSDQNVPRDAVLEVFQLTSAPSFFDGFRCSGSAGPPVGSDLALLRVATYEGLEQIRKGSPIRGPADLSFAIEIATPGMIYEDRRSTTRLVAAGFGRIDDGTLPRDLRHGAIPIASLFCGQNAFAGTPCYGGREFVLADQFGAAGGTDTCGGDSGGPVFYAAESNSHVSVMLVGITSRALRNANQRVDLACGGGGIYTAVGSDSVVQWLRSEGINVIIRADAVGRRANER